MTDLPISVPSSPTVGQLTAAVRTLLAAAGGYIVAKGWLTSDLVNAIIPVVLIGAPLIWDQLRVRSDNAKQQTMASAVSNSIAQVK